MDTEEKAGMSGRMKDVAASQTGLVSASQAGSVSASQKGHVSAAQIKLAAGCILLVILVLLAILVPTFSPYSYSAQDADAANLGFSVAHWFGTDKFGRDLFTRVWYGARLSLSIGLGSALICGIIGTLLGSAAGYFGGILDQLVMRTADVVDAIPSLLYVILITLVLGSNAGSILLGICICGWIETARIVRGEVLRQKASEYCQASRLLGASSGRIIRHHILPNLTGPLIVNMTFFIPKAIFTEAFLSFVGVGIAAPAASLGTLISDGRLQMRLYPQQLLCPVLVLCLLLVALNLIGTGLEEKES